jgi:hypothetical protein
VLLYPVVHFTTNVTVIRIYLSLLGSVGLYLGLRPWLRLGYSRAVAGAALLLSGLWATTFFGALVQPNMMVAVVALGVVGYSVLALRAPRKRRYLIAAGGWLALMALLRPSDATWLAVPLVLVLLLIREQPLRRRMLVGSVLLVGLGLGWSEWVIEAFVSYGGFFHRLHEANALNTPGIHFSLLTEARDINGPVLCRPCTGVPLTVSHFAWWFAVPPLTAIGLLSTRRTPRFVPLVLATVAGTAILLEYCLTISYAAPRFLLPTYALLALPCAAGLAAIFRWRPDTTLALAVIAAVFGLLGAQFAGEAQVAHRDVVHAADNRNRFLDAAAALRAVGVGAPCVINGHFGPPVAFALGCSDEPKGAAAIARVNVGTTVAVLTPGRAAHAYRGWQSVPLKSTGTWTAHIRAPDGIRP